ncbi:MAG: OadG family protein [Nitrospinae bacterium]|nr:OadG family protein [Nitrospinota bacterium]
MDPYELLDKGFIVMVLGMGMVFLFLTVLTFAMNFIQFIASKFETAPTHTAVETHSQANDKTQVAIAAAIALHLKKKG